MEISKKNFLKPPETAGVYTFLKQKRVIYIGKSVNLKSRLNSYLLVNLGPKTTQMIKEADDMTYIKVTSELESLLLESFLIKKYKPKYNILSKDDKHALYIVITKEKFPRVITSRKSGDFGPFPSSSNVKTVLKLIRKIFPFSDHKIGKKPCFYSYLELCNPCPNEIVQSTKYLVLRKKYMQNIKNIKLVLSRKFNIVRNSLEKEMYILSRQEKFEEAKEIKNKIQALDYITQPVNSEQSFLENPNLSEDLRLSEINNLKKIISNSLHRIECFDIAHLSGTNATASMVVFIDGLAEKSKYKHFKIRQTNTQSDYDSMREIAERRANHFKSWGKPDLIIVDGGLGQVKIFNEEFRKLEEFSNFNISVVGIAKNPDRLVFPSGNKIVLQGQTLQLLSRIRDEAHRFARRYHHLLIHKNLLH